MHSNKFDGKLVIKPWGAETLVHYNNDIELWRLDINYNNCTSFHSHPNKRTALLVLDGTAKITFMNGHQILNKLDKVILRPGLFHSTTALSPNGLRLIEVETPPDKDDIIRLFDNYGRVGKPYESSDKYIDHPVTKMADIGKNFELDGCNFCRKSVDTDYVPTDGEIILVLCGGLIANNHKLALSAGDIVDSNTFRLLRNSFKPQDLEILVITSTSEL